MYRLFLATAMAPLLLTACGAMEVEVVNETSGDLYLSMADQQEVIPPGTSLFEYKGAPAFNKSWDIPMDVTGDYVLTRRTVPASREQVTTVVFTQGDMNAFVVTVTNDTGARIDSLWFANRALDGGIVAEGERPGSNHGPLSAGEAVDVPLEHIPDQGWDFVYYQGGDATLDTSAAIQVEAAGLDASLSL